MTLKNYYQIDTLIPEILNKLAPFRERHPLTFNPTKAALLIIDMQRYFSEETSHAFIPNMADIVPNIVELQKQFAANNLTIIQTQHQNKLENAHQMQSWWGSIVTDNDPLASLTPALAFPTGKLITKTQYDAFWQTDLEHYLRKANITQILITGVMTHLCCETTARTAFIRNFEVYFAIDATATYNFDFHMATLLNLAHGFAKPILAREVLEGFIL